MDHKFRFIGTKEDGYSVDRLQGGRGSAWCFGDVKKTAEGWVITITTPPPAESTWDPVERAFVRSCMCGKETLPPHSTRYAACVAGSIRYDELRVARYGKTA